VQHIAWLYRIEKDARELPEHKRLAMQQARATLRNALYLVASGALAPARRQRRCPPSATDYSLSCKAALTAYVIYGNVAINNNHIENFTRPRAMGCKA
jgi:transposase